MRYRHETSKVTKERELGVGFKSCALKVLAHIRLLRNLSTWTIEGHLRHLSISRALELFGYLGNYAPAELGQLKNT